MSQPIPKPCPVDPNCTQYTGGSHYHCGACGRPAGSMLGHHVGGSRPDARTICDDDERRAYLTKIWKEN